MDLMKNRNGMEPTVTVTDDTVELVPQEIEKI